MENISTLKQQDHFKIFLSDINTNKILFSGKFGSGKTTFLKTFFNNHNQFNAIYLYPVNYSVATNEDIFEYIKYDILVQFLQWNDINIYLDDISNSLAAKVLFLNDPKGFIIKLIKSYSKLSSVTEKIDSFITGTEQLKNELDKYKESQQIDEFMTEILNDKGNIFEHNLITSIICSIIDKWRVLNKGKQICLVIDDMDRIDPEHIFRIMNVLAAHNDIEDESKNKFGFDKIITVCDVQNIQNIYHSKYGIDTDFKGYISKFHSRSIFYFDFTKEIIKQLDTIFSKNTIDGQNLINDYSYFYDDRLKPVLIQFIINNTITIRTIKQTYKNVSFETRQLYSLETILYEVDNNEYLFWLYDVLINMFNGKEYLFKAIHVMKINHPLYPMRDRINSYNKYYSLFCDIVSLLDRNNNSDRQNNYEYNYNENINVTYKKGVRFGLSYNIEIENMEEILKTSIPLWEMLEKSFLKIEQIKRNPR